jgi:hypothetical protein
MATRDEVSRLNQELADKIQDETARDPNSPYAGKWIGLANGRVVIVSEDGEEVFKRLGEVEPDPALTLIVEGAAISQYDWIEFEEEGECRE